MKGYAVIIRNKDRSHYFSRMAHGMQTPVSFAYDDALDWARDLRKHGIDAQVVKVEYADPVIVGPKRFLEGQP